MGLGHTHAGHHHGHDHSHPGVHHGGDRKNAGGSSAHRSALIRALAVTLVFAAIEIVGGYLSNSLALISDAVHMLADAGALGLSLTVLWFARREAPKGYTYGYQRVEVLGALLNALLVWLVAGLLIFESIERFQNPTEVKGRLLLGVASIGLGANLISLYFLHRSSKENLNVRSAYLHVLSDALGSVGAMIAGAVIALTNWTVIDPIITVLMSGLMLWSSWRLISESVAVLMEKTPGHLRIEEIQSALLGMNGVTGVHDLHVWTLSSGSVALSAHVIGKDADAILHEAAHLLEERFQITHTTIQIERVGSEMSEHCESCD